MHSDEPLSKSPQPYKLWTATSPTLSDWLAILVILAFLASGIITLPHYGLSWDEGLGNLFFGERYFYYLTTFQDKFLDFKSELAIHGKYPLNLYLSRFRDYPNEFPALADTLSAASMHFFSYRLGWLDPVDAWHLFTIIISALFLWVLYFFASRHMGKWPALLGILYLAIFPRFWGDMHFNPKDIPETVFAGFFIMAYTGWHEKPGWRKAILTGVLFGCALGIKANALFLPFIVIVGLWNKRDFLWQHGSQRLLIAGHYLAMFFTAITVYFVSWPYLYADPLRVKEYFTYILSQGNRQGASNWSWNPLLQSIGVTPEIMLVFLLAGLVAIIINIRQLKSSWNRLLLAWLLLPVIRISLPGMVNFDGIRHYMEYVPAAALVSGMGTACVINLIQKYKPHLKIAAPILIGLGITINSALIWHAYQPYPHLFYNRFVGGISGAGVLFGEGESTDYWGTSYRQGLRWLNDNADKNAILYVPVADWLVELSAPLWLRPDIRLVNRDEPNLLSSQQPVYVMFITRKGFYDEIALFCTEMRTPVQEIVIDGVAVLEIYRLID